MLVVSPLYFKDGLEIHLTYFKDGLEIHLTYFKDGLEIHPTFFATVGFTENYSLDRNKNKNKKPMRRSTGRKPSKFKGQQAADHIDIYSRGRRSPGVHPAAIPVSLENHRRQGQLLASRSCVLGTRKR